MEQNHHDAQKVTPKEDDEVTVIYEIVERDDDETMDDEHDHYKCDDKSCNCELMETVKKLDKFIEVKPGYAQNFNTVMEIINNWVGIYQQCKDSQTMTVPPAAFRTLSQGIIDMIDQFEQLKKINVKMCRYVIESQEAIDEKEEAMTRMDSERQKLVSLVQSTNDACAKTEEKLKKAQNLLEQYGRQDVIRAFSEKTEAAKRKELEERHKDLVRQIQVLEKNLRRESKQSAVLRGELSELRGSEKSSELEKQNQELRAQVVKLTDAADHKLRLQDRIKSLEEALATAEAFAQDYKKDAGSLRSAYDTLEADHECTLAEVRALSASNDALQQELETTNQLYADAAEQGKAAGKELVAARRELRQAQRGLEEAETLANKNSAYAIDMTNKCEKLQAKVLELEQRASGASEWEQKALDAEQRTAERQEYAEALAKRSKANGERAIDAERKLGEAEDALKKNRRFATGLTVDFNILKKRVEELTAQAAEKDEALQAMATYSEALQVQLSGAEEQVKAAGSALQQTSAFATEAMLKYDVVLMKAAAAEEARQEAEKRLADTVKQHSDLKRLHEAAERSIDSKLDTMIEMKNRNDELRRALMQMYDSASAKDDRAMLVAIVKAEQALGFRRM